MKLWELTFSTGEVKYIAASTALKAVENETETIISLTLIKDSITVKE